MADSVNKQLQQLIITHAHYVEKYKTYESNKMLKILEAADDALTAELAKNKGTIATERRLKKQLEAIKALEEGYSQVFYDEFTGDLKAFAGTEVGWYVERLRELTSPYVNLKIQRLNKNFLRSCDIIKQDIPSRKILCQIVISDTSYKGD